MEHIKLFEELHVMTIGKLYKICSDIMSVGKVVIIAKFFNFKDLDKRWGYFEGYIIYPEHLKGLKWSDDIYLNNLAEPVSEKEKEFYEFYDNIEKYNL
jgi:hypothetical protein